MSVLDVLAAASKEAEALASTQPRPEESRFPVVVSGDTRAYLDAQCAALGLSLAGLAGTILNEVVAESKRRNKGKNTRG